MKKVCFIAVFVYVFIFQIQLFSQQFNYIDKNPTDIAYLRNKEERQPLVKVVYGRPNKSKRHV